MNFNNIEPSKIDYQAYGNLRDLIRKNPNFFMELSKKEQDLFYDFIYNLFTNLPDKGVAYKNSLFNDRNQLLYKQPTNNRAECISLKILSENYMNAVCYDGIIIEKYPEGISLSATLSLNNRIRTVISGRAEPKKASSLQIVTADYNYEITGASLFAFFASLSECIVSQSTLKELEETNNARSDLQAYLKSNYPFLDDFQLSRFISENVNFRYPLSSEYPKISNYIIEQFMNHFISEVEKGFIKDTSITVEPITGLDVGADAIKRFGEYEVEIFGQKVKLIDIELFMQDDDTICYCPYLDALNTLPKEDTDVYIVGLCYFATYCDKLGKVDSHNRYGSTIARRLSGQKLNTAIKSTLLGVWVADYASSRAEIRKDNYDESAFLMRDFFNRLGFGNAVNIFEPQNVDVTEFKRITFPYVRGHKRSGYHLY